VNICRSKLVCIYVQYEMSRGSIIQVKTILASSKSEYYKNTKINQKDCFQPYCVIYYLYADDIQLYIILDPENGFRFSSS